VIDPIHGNFPQAVIKSEMLYCEGGSAKCGLGEGVAHHIHLETCLAIQWYCTTWKESSTLVSLKV